MAKDKDQDLGLTWPLKPTSAANLFALEAALEALGRAEPSARPVAAKAAFEAACEKCKGQAAIDLITMIERTSSNGIAGVDDYLIDTYSWIRRERHFVTSANMQRVNGDVCAFIVRRIAERWDPGVPSGRSLAAFRFVCDAMRMEMEHNVIIRAAEEQLEARAMATKDYTDLHPWFEERMLPMLVQTLLGICRLKKGAHAVLDVRRDNLARARAMETGD